MPFFRSISRFFTRDTFGVYALAALAVVILSGVALAIPYDAADPSGSVRAMMLYNAPASWLRNLHYWSAQLFLVLVLLHMWEQLKDDGERYVAGGVWLRLILALSFLFFAMLSGFILKGDADSMQAQRILADLLGRIPWAGNTLAYFFLGKEGSFGILYMQHIAVATLIVVIVTIEHSRRLWPPARPFVVTFLVTSLAALFLIAPLHDPHDPVLKGPWYFVGLQEILHWMHHPGYSLYLLLLLLTLLWALPVMKKRPALWGKRLLLALVVVYGLLTVTGYYFRGEAWRWRNPLVRQYRGSSRLTADASLVRSLLTSAALSPADSLPASRDEGCIVCHSGTHGYAAAHDPAVVGCSSCHLGDPYTPDRRRAHHGMVLVPGNLQEARLTCGTAQCHPDISDRIQTSLMASLSGMIAVDKYVFGERADPDGRYHVDNLKKKKKLTAAESHLQNLCVACHLGNPKEQPARISGQRRGGGCNACHLNHNDTTWSDWQAYVAGGRQASLLPRSHPSLTLDITDNHCFACHSRSGRIATNYEGWHETFLTATEMPDSIHYRLLEDGRVFVKKPDDVHHAAGMGCIDCHTSYELMGDHKEHPHEEDQVTVRCEDCHTGRSRPVIARNKLDAETARIAEMRHFTGDSVIAGVRSANPLLNVQHTDSGYVLITKGTGKVLPLAAPAPVCSRDGVHGDLSCSACHTAWAPSCLGCHTAYEPRTQGFDMLHGERPMPGTWVEYTGMMDADPPALGIRTRNSQREIVTVIPGMVLTVDTASYPLGTPHDTLFRRLFAPTEAHTTMTRGRSCKSCHNDPQALGFGKGKLTYHTENGEGRWTFTPLYALMPQDSLAEDAWTAFLKGRSGAVSTRSNVRPFTVEEQQRILTVGACLTCHPEASKVMQRSLTEWKKVFAGRSKRCVVPEY